MTDLLSNILTEVWARLWVSLILSCFPQNVKQNMTDYKKVLTIVIYLGFPSRTFTIHRTAGKGGSHLYKSSLSLPPASLILTYKQYGYCRELTSAQSWQLGSTRELLTYKRKSLTTVPHALKDAKFRQKWDYLQFFTG